MLLGFDIGGTKCAVVLGVNIHQQISVIAKTVLPTNGLPYTMIQDLFDAAELQCAANNLSIESIDGIGISCGGPLDSRHGVILSPPNLPGWDNIPIVAMVQKRFGKKTILQNDANACACAEWRYGAGKGYNDIVFLTFGTGMGAGLILNGKLYAGSSSLAGEVGHIRLEDDGPEGYGKRGSFEGFCSGGGIARMAQHAARGYLRNGKQILFCEDEKYLPLITAESVAYAAIKGDEVAINIFNECGRYLGKGLSMIIDMLNPELIIIGSIYARAQAFLEPAMQAVIAQEALPQAYAACKIMPALLGDAIGDIAALALADMASVAS